MSDDRIQKLKDRKSQIEAQLKKLEAQARAKERRQDTRRKIIAGALALKHAEIDTAFGETLHSLIDRHTTNKLDRELFGLGPVEEKNPANQDKENLSEKFDRK